MDVDSTSVAARVVVAEVVDYRLDRAAVVAGQS